MAASKTYFARANYRFLPTDQTLTKGSTLTMFELDESEVWNMEARSASPEFQKASSKISRKSTSLASRVDGGPASLPVNVPDWSKILKEEYRENRGRDSEGDDFEDEYVENGNLIPPHEFLARQMARTRMVSFSVHEGIGRTLKGRDLSTVRNAIWEKIGFQD